MEKQIEQDPKIQEQIDVMIAAEEAAIELRSEITKSHKDC